MRRLAVVGCGPKGLAALVELDRALAHAPASQWSRAEVHVFDTSEPGPGTVWDTHTPFYLIMNVPARIVDLSGPTFPYSYVGWAATHADPRAREVFPPRALMGEYLSAVFAALQSSPRLDISVHHERVSQISPAVQWGWFVQDFPTSPRHGPYDAVLLATGHRDPLARGWYELLADGTSEGSSEEMVIREVVIRGAALTAIDATLCLTTGRGGLFVADDSLADGQLRYIPSGREPETITLRSRTGVPLSPKPEALPDSLRDTIEKATASLLTILDPDEPSPSDAWWKALVNAALTVAHTLGIETTQHDLENTLLEPDRLLPGETADTRMQRHLHMNHGKREPDLRWLWGRIWHTGYTNIISSLVRRPRDRDQWAKFRAAAANAERWAYGPPETSVQRLLALHRDGRLRWEAAGSSERKTAHTQPQLNAVTHGPGIRRESDGTVPDPLWDGLVRARLVTIRAGERGALTNRVAQCVAPNGTPTPGLYAIGRPTEDPVIGHDTLNHRLHPDIQQWAQHLVDNSTERPCQNHSTPPEPRH